MKDFLKVAGALALIITFFVGMIWLSVSNWNECREHFSFIYCLTR